METCVRYLCLFVYSGVQHILCCAFCFVCFRLVSCVDVANYPALSIPGCQFIVCDFKTDMLLPFLYSVHFLTSTLQFFFVFFFPSVMLRSSRIKNSLDLGELEHNPKWWIYIRIYVLLNIDMYDIEMFCLFYALLYIYYQ